MVDMNGVTAIAQGHRPYNPCDALVYDFCSYPFLCGQDAERAFFVGDTLVFVCDRHFESSKEDDFDKEVDLDTDGCRMTLVSDLYGAAQPDSTRFFLGEGEKNRRMVAATWVDRSQIPTFANLPADSIKIEDRATGYRGGRNRHDMSTHELLIIDALRAAARIAREHAATPPEIPGFEGTRSALDGLTIRKEKTSD